MEALSKRDNSIFSLFQVKSDELKPIKSAKICEENKCSVCFNYVTNLRYHMITQHSQHLACTFCRSVFQIEDGKKFKRHMFRHIVLEKGINQCVQCGLSWKEARSKAEHLEKFGSNHNDECAQCSQKLSSYQVLNFIQFT